MRPTGGGPGWCSAHHSRVVRHGDPQADKPILGSRNVGPCRVEGCNFDAEVRGWCSGHYTLVIKTSGPQEDVPLRRNRTTRPEPPPRTGPIEVPDDLMAADLEAFRIRPTERDEPR